MAGAAKAGIGWVFVARPPDEPTLVADLTTADFTLVFTTAEGGLWKNPVDCAAGMGEQ